MPELTSLFKRLRHMSIGECRERMGQELAKHCERWLGLHQGELTDEQFLRLVRPELRSRFDDDGPFISGVDSWEALTSDRLPSAFMPGLIDRDRMAGVMNVRFHNERAALLARADRAVQGRFDLLGLRNLYFGDPIDWRLEPTSGKRTALDHWATIPYLDERVVGDKKIVWELNRHAHLVTLGQAYWLTREERYADAFVSHLTSWMETNPPRRGINWTSTLEVAFRSIAWLWALHLFAGSDRLTPSFRHRVVKGLTQHGLYIQSYLSHYFSPNTHLTGEALGLFYLGTTLTGLSVADTWRDLGLSILLEQLPKQVRADGIYFEQSSYYHRYTVEFYLHLILRARVVGVSLPTWVETTVKSMLDHLMWITRPDGRVTLYGDDDGGRLLSFSDRAPDDVRDTLALGAALYGRSDWKAIAGNSASEMVWLTGLDALQIFDDLEAISPMTRARVYEESGYAVLRDGWEQHSAYLFIDSGTHGALRSGHAHADALSFEFAVQGITWIVDPGTFTYTGDPRARDEFRTTSGHNTIMVDGLSQSIPAGPFSWSHIAAARLLAAQVDEGPMSIKGSHDGYMRLTSPVRHTRAFSLSKRPDRPHAPSYVAMEDVLESDGPHRYEVRFHLDPDCVSRAQGHDALLLHRSGKRLLIGVRQMIGGEPGPPVSLLAEPGWVSRCYADRQPAIVLAGAWEAEGALTLMTILLPLEAGESADVNDWLMGHFTAMRRETGALV